MRSITFVTQSSEVSCRMLPLYAARREDDFSVMTVFVLLCVLEVQTRSKAKLFSINQMVTIGAIMGKFVMSALNVSQSEKFVFSCTQTSSDLFLSAYEGMSMWMYVGTYAHCE